LNGKPIVVADSMDPDDMDEISSDWNKTHGEGCNLAGYIIVDRARGHCQIAMGKSYKPVGKHVRAFNPPDRSSFQISHTIHNLHLDYNNRRGMGNDGGGELDGTRVFVDERNGTTGTFHYWLDTIPIIHNGIHEFTRYKLKRTRFVPLFDTSVSPTTTNDILPGVFFTLEMSSSTELWRERLQLGILEIMVIILLTVVILLSLLCIDEYSFGARKQLTTKIRARLLLVV